jgi:hypothetical protein
MDSLMTTTLEFRQSSHLNPELSDPTKRQLTGEKLIGRWTNTNHETKGMAECVIARDGDHYSISILGVGKDAPIEWPTTRATTLANLEEEAGQRTVALVANFDLGFMLAQTQIRINRGVLVITLFNSFKDDSGRSNYVTREFFCQHD